MHKHRNATRFVGSSGHSERSELRSNERIAIAIEHKTVAKQLCWQLGPLGALGALGVAPGAPGLC